MSLRHFLLACAAACLPSLIVTAQAPASRIAGPIDESQLIALPGNTPPAANSLNDRGPVASSLRLTDLILVLRRDPAQQAAFDTFVAAQYDPGSPNFHHWLAPADVAARFGPSAADVSSVSGWLASRGLSVDQVSADHMTIRFSGAAAQVQNAFHTSIHTLSVDGQPHIANVSDPRIPAALGPVVMGVKALHNFLPRPAHHAGGLVQFNSSKGQWQRVASTQARAQPSLAGVKPDLGITIGTGTSQYSIEDVTPYDFATIYNVLPLWTASTPIDGAGQTIAIAGTSDINAADVVSFRNIFGLPAGTAPKTIVANGVDPGLCTSTGGYCTIEDLTENTLDVEWSGAVAPGASIDLVVSGQTSPMTDTLYSSANYVVQNATANILSVSYGECELAMGTAGNAAWNNMWQTAATEGIAVFVAAGDSGAATCDQGQAYYVPYLAQYGLTVSGIASTPYDTAVGGTDLNWNFKPAPYWNSSNSSTTGANAAGYIPELPWNDSCTNPAILFYFKNWAQTLQKNGYNATSPTDPESACNFVNQWWSVIANHTNPQVNLAYFINTIGGGGGRSTCTTSNGETIASCSAGYPKPSWQAGVTGIPNDSKRDIPDVSFFAGNGLLGSAYLVCVSANGACLASTSPASEPVAQEIGGTSVGTPAMAGVMALINQKMAAPQGSPNAELYSQASKENYGSCKSESVTTAGACSFNDIDEGNISMACGLGSPDCNIATSGDSVGILKGYAATAGFDRASGLGSLNVYNVVNSWTATVGAAPASVTVTPAQSSIQINQPLKVTVAVAGSSGTPTGNVTIVGGGYDGGAGTLASGASTFTIPALSLPAGSVTLTGSYQGDSTYAEASATSTVTVTKILPGVRVQLNPSSVGANAPVFVIVTVSGPSGSPSPTGTLNVSVASFSGSCPLNDAGACTVTIPENTLPNGNLTVTASYQGDAYYQAADGTDTLPVNALTPTLTITPAVPTVDTLTPLQVNFMVTGSGPTPTGAIDLAGAFGGTLNNGLQLTCILTAGSCSITMPPGDLYSGTDTLTAKYSGDLTYFASQPVSTTVNVTKSNPTLSAKPASTSIYSNQVLHVTVSTTSSAEAPTGSVTLSSGGYTLGGSTGQYCISCDWVIPAGSLAVGTDTITVSYAGDAFFNPATTSFTVNVAEWTKVTPTLTVTPSSTTIGVGQQLNVKVDLAGSSGKPTGTVTFSSGSWNSGPEQIYSGGGTFTIPSNTLALGADTLTVTYSGDPTYLTATTSVNITVNPSSFTISAGTAPALNPGQSGSVLVAAKTTDGYSGNVTFTCALTSSPSGAQDLPTCVGLTLTLQGVNTNNGNVTVNTTAPTAALTRPDFRGLGGLGGATLAFLVFLRMPARRRSWRNLLGVAVVFLAFAGLSACGGSGSTGGGGGGGGNSGTTAGTYTFTLTGTGAPAVTPAPTATFTVKVN